MDGPSHQGYPRGGRVLISYLNLGAGGIAGAVLAFGLLAAYNSAVENPRIRAETRAIVNAENARLTQAAINEVSNDAEKARAMRRFCLDSGMQYDFAAIKCRQAATVPHG